MRLHLEKELPIVTKEEQPLQENKENEVRENYSVESYEEDCFPEEYSDVKPDKETGKHVPGLPVRAETYDEDETPQHQRQGN